MQQLTFVSPGKLEWREGPDPVIQSPKEAIVRPIAVATCDLDTAVVTGRAPFKGPFAFGHEAIAEVVAVGEAVTRFKPGDRVAVSFQITCGECANCSRGLNAHCLSVPPRSMYGLSLGGDFGGMLSDLAKVPFADAMMVPLSPSLDPATVASAGDNIADAWRAVAPYVQDSPGAPVLILGGGALSISLYAVAIAKGLGAGQVDLVDTDPGRLALAAKLGANAIERLPERPTARYPIVVDASGEKDWLVHGVRSVEPEGVLTSVAMYFEPLTGLPLREMYGSGIRFLTGRVNSRAALPGVLNAIERGCFDPSLVTSAVVPWDEAAEALATPATKYVVVR